MESRNKEKVIGNIKSLIQSIYKGASEQAVEELMRHSMRIMNSFIGSGAN